MKLYHLNNHYTHCRLSYISVPDSRVRLTTPIDRDFMAQRLEEAVMTPRTTHTTVPDVLNASFLDVAVLRCLFAPNWPEQAIFWALRCVSI